MSFRINTRLQLTGVFILKVALLLYTGWGCGDEIKKTDNAGESVFTLPKDALGAFTGRDSGYYLDVGRNQVFVPPSTWILKLNNASIFLKQSSEAATFQYEGPFLVETENDTVLAIVARLSENRTQSVYTPRLRYRKNESVWLLENSNREEEVVLIRQ